MTMRRSSIRSELSTISAETFDDDTTSHDIAESLVRLAERIETEGVHDASRDEDEG